MRIKKVSSTSVLKGNVIDSLDGNSTTNAPSIAAVKRGTLSYIDEGYPEKPIGFTIVKTLPEYQEPGVIYFVCPIPNIFVNLSLTNYMGDNWVNNSGPVIISYDDVNTQGQFDMDTLGIDYNTSGYGGNTWESVEKEPFPIGINLGVSCPSESTTEATLSATFEQRDPKTTILEWWGSCEVSCDGTKQYIQDNQYGEGGTATLYLKSGGSYSLYMYILPVGGSACLKGDTFIKTSKGFKMIKDIQVGDTVIDKENKEVLVTKTFSHEVDYLVNTRLSNGAKIQSSISHKFETNWGIVKSINLVKDMKLKCGNGSTFKVMKSECLKTEKPEMVYEIMTETGSYQLENGIINICEEI